MSLLRNLAGGLRGLFRKPQVEREMDEELRGYLHSARDLEDAPREKPRPSGAGSAYRDGRRGECKTTNPCGELGVAGGNTLAGSEVWFANAAIQSCFCGRSDFVSGARHWSQHRHLPALGCDSSKSAPGKKRSGTDGGAHRGTQRCNRCLRIALSQSDEPMWSQIRQQQALSGVFAWGPTSFNISPGGPVHTVQGLWVRGEFFGVLGIVPERGRLLSPEDDRAECASSRQPRLLAAGGTVATKFIVGRKITIEKHPFAVTGVAPASFYGVEVGRNFDGAVPLCGCKEVWPERKEELTRGAGMPRSGLRGDFAGNHPTQRFGARNRELHVPKVYFRRDELHPDILLAVASPMDRDDTGLHRLRGVIIHQDQRLSHQHDLFKLKQRPVPVHRLRMGLRRELLAGVCLSVDGQRHGQCYPQGTTTFFATKVKQGHFGFDLKSDL